MGYLLSLLPESFLWIGCLSCILVLGVPHGALDIYLIWSDSERNLRKSFVSICRYISLVFLALFLWRISSELFWFLFFFAAVYHFGISDEHPEVISAIFPRAFSRLVWIYSRGLVLVFSPATFHSEKVFMYLKNATTDYFAQVFSAIAPFLFGYGLLFYVLISGLYARRTASRAYRMLIVKLLVSLLVMVVLFAVSDPLVGFCLYFCCHHSIAHCFRVANVSRVRKMVLLGLAVLFTLPVIPICLWSGTKIWGGLLPEGMVITLFVSIAALTFPHLFVVEKLHHKLQRAV
jgi:Brp/Blh family beta-carotene 15,15'-monooxygenase